MGALRAEWATVGMAVALWARAASGAAPVDVIAWQAALDRAMFSPGVIDGAWGVKSQRALREFQASRGLPVTGACDGATRLELRIDSIPALATYTVTQADIAEVGPWPSGWIEKSQVERLGYKSVAALVAERGHCSIALLGRLNPRARLDALNVGETLTIPNVSDAPPPVQATALQVNLVCKYIRALDREGRTIALVNCSIARHKEKRPRGRCTVKVVSPEPSYVFDPKMWPEVKGIDRKLVIPPGPRNPVGLFWIGLSLPGYGIHGTPEPELIGKTGSHGCFRLTNWDAVRLGAMVRPGTPVEFITGDAPPLPRPIADSAAPPKPPIARPAASSGATLTRVRATVP